MAKLYDYCATCRRPKRPSSSAYCCYRCEMARGSHEPPARFDLLEQLHRATAARDVVPHWERDRIDAEVSRLLREALGV